MKKINKACLSAIGIGLAGCIVFATLLDASGQSLDISDYFNIHMGIGDFGTLHFGPHFWNEDTGSEYEDCSEIFEGDITGLDFEVGAAKLNFVAGEKFSIETQNVSLTDNYVSGGVWYLNAAAKTVNFSIGSQNEAVITVTIPENAVFDTVNLEIGAGIIENCDIKAEEIYVTVGAGRYMGGKLDASEILNIEVGVGSFEGSCTAPAEIWLECGMGNLKLNADASEKEYNIYMDCGIGNAQAGSLKISGTGEKNSTWETAEKELTVDCGMGNVAVEFTK